MGRQRIYDSNVRAEAKYLFLDKELNPRPISRHFGGKPRWQTIQVWANEVDKATGLNWYQEREKRAKDKYLKLSPQSQAQGLMDALNHIIGMITSKISKGQTDAKELSTMTDSLAKVNKTLEKIVDKKFQVPMLYEFIEKFISFLNLHYKEFITPEFINAVKHFKNETRKHLEY